MDDVAGLEGWRWIFILEGILTVIIAVASFWMLFDYPDTASFMTLAEREFVKRRLHEDTDGLSTAFKKKFVLQSFLDWRTWAFSFMYIGALMPVYSFSLFSPTLVANLGYVAATAQLLSVPPYVLAALTTVAAGFLSDRSQKRGIYVLGFSIIGMIGFILCIAAPADTPAMGNAGGVISSFIYRRADRPRYFLGHGVVIGFQFM